MPARGWRRIEVLHAASGRQMSRELAHPPNRRRGVPPRDTALHPDRLRLAGQAEGQRQGFVDLRERLDGHVNPTDADVPDPAGVVASAGILYLSELGADDAHVPGRGLAQDATPLLGRHWGSRIIRVEIVEPGACVAC